MNYAQCHPNKPNASRGLCDACRLKRDYSKRKAKIVAWIKANPEKRVQYWRNRQLKKLGLSYSDYVALWNTQRGACAGCGAINTKLVVDHDHKTNIARGLLCQNCNLALGLMRDNPDNIQRLQLYLLRGGRKLP